MKKEKEVIIKNVEKHYIDTIYEGSADGLPEGFEVVYRDSYWKKKNENVCYTDSTITIGTRFGTYFKMHPSLDAYLKIENGIVYCTSDSKLELFDTKTGKGTTVSMSIVAFGRENSLDVDDKYITIKGIGCYWGCKFDEVEFEIKLTRKNLICIKNETHFVNED